MVGRKGSRFLVIEAVLTGRDVCNGCWWLFPNGDATSVHGGGKKQAGALVYRGAFADSGLLLGAEMWQPVQVFWRPEGRGAPRMEFASGVVFAWRG